MSWSKILVDNTQVDRAHFLAAAVELVKKGQGLLRTHRYRSMNNKKWEHICIYVRFYWETMDNLVNN